MNGARRRIRVALEAATNRLSVAADRGAAGGDTPVEFTLDGARRHAGGLLPLLARALDGLEASPAEIGLVLVSDGPGSFTGLRVGAAAAKAIAASGDADVWVASTLLVRAAAHARPGLRILALSEALRGQAFAGVWEFGAGGRIEARLTPRALAPLDLVNLPALDLAVGEAPEPFRIRLEEQGIPLLTPGWPSARTLLTLADRIGGARRVDPVHWEPDYGRPAEAQARWERTHGRSLPDPARDTG